MTYFDPDKSPELDARNREAMKTNSDVVSDIRKTGWQEGERVIAPWGRAWLHVGTVSQIEATRLYVIFDDGTCRWAPIDQVRPLSMVNVGTRVRCRWGRRYLSGAVAQLKGNLVFVRYDDGHGAWTTISVIIIPSGLSPSWWDYFVGAMEFLFLLGFIVFMILFFGSRFW